MAQRKTLTEAQSALLRWIDDGCPDGVYEGFFHRISAAALERRGLLAVTGKGPAWSAELTEAGEEYLAKVDGPAPPVPRQANRPVTEQMIDDIVSAGGSMRVPKMRYGKGVDWDQRVRQAIRHNKVPAGKRLEYESNWEEDTAVVRLVNAPEGTDLVLSPVPVPEHVARYHRIVQDVRNDKSRLEVSNTALPRASRILHALVTEAERRGYECSIPKGHRSRNNNAIVWSAGTDGHLVVTVAGHSEALRIHEEGLRVNTVYKRPAWDSADPLDYRHSGTYRQVRDDSDATGRLTISLVPEQYRSVRIATWSDRKRWTLDSKLPDLLAEIAVRAAEAAHERQEAERRAAARQVAWEAAMVEAKQRHHDARRATALDDQMTRWREANEIRAYCAAMAAEHPDNAGTTELIEWALARADRLDPLSAPPASPPRLAKIPLEELRPHLQGLSPHGPDAKY